MMQVLYNTVLLEIYISLTYSFSRLLIYSVFLAVLTYALARGRWGGGGGQGGGGSSKE